MFLYFKVANSEVYYDKSVIILFGLLAKPDHHVPLQNADLLYAFTQLPRRQFDASPELRACIYQSESKGSTQFNHAMDS